MISSFKIGHCGTGRRALLWVILLGAVTGSAVAASYSYEKNVVKLLLKDPGLAPEIVEALKDCRLVNGMTEEQATLVGRRWNRPTEYQRRFGEEDPSLDRITAKDEQGRKLLRVRFFTEVPIAAGASAAGTFQARRQENSMITNLVLYFTNGELTKWEAPRLVGQLNDTDRAKIRKDIESRLAKSRAKR